MGHVCVHVFVCSGSDAHMIWAELVVVVVLFSVSIIFCYFANSVLECVWILYSKMPHATTLCSSALTVIHYGLPQGHWGWVSTQSELYIKPIGLIYSPNNSRLIKKIKGRGGI